MISWFWRETLKQSPSSLGTVTHKSLLTVWNVRFHLWDPQVAIGNASSAFAHELDMALLLWIPKKNIKLPHSPDGCVNRLGSSPSMDKCCLNQWYQIAKLAGRSTSPCEWWNQLPKQSPWCLVTHDFEFLAWCRTKPSKNIYDYIDDCHNKITVSNASIQRKCSKNDQYNVKKHINYLL